MSSTYPDISFEEQQGNEGKTFLYFVFAVALFYFFGGSGGCLYIKSVITNFVTFSLLMILWWKYESNFFVSSQKKFLSFAFLSAILFSYSRGSNINGYISQFFFWLTITMIIMLSRTAKEKMLAFFTKWFAVVLVISFACFLLAKMGVPLPHEQYIPNEELAENGSMYVFNNYFIFMEFDYEYFNVSTIPRFQAFFIEPAYLGTVCMLMIIANDFNFKNNYVKILFAMMLVSVSLAAYLIFSYSYLLHLSLCKKKWSYFWWTIVIIAGCTIVYTYLPEDNAVDFYIRDRLFENGEFELKSNRTTIDFENYFWDTFVDTEELFWGGDLKGMQLAADTKSVDYKFFLVHYGILGVVFYLFFLIVLFIQTKSKRTFILLSSFILLLLQSSWLGQYFTYLVPILLGSFIFSEEQPSKQSMEA